MKVNANTKKLLIELATKTRNNAYAPYSHYLVGAALITNDGKIFTYFYTAITLNPTQMAEDMKRNNGFIPGVKPGKETAEYIETIMSRITFPGSLFIAFIAVMPALARKRSKRCPASLGPMVNSFIRFFLYSRQSGG